MPIANRKVRSRELNRGFTLDILGEAVISDREAEEFFHAYTQLIKDFAPEVNAWPENRVVDQGVLRALPRLNLSIKLSALNPHFDPIDPGHVLATAGERFRQLLRVAREHQAFVNVDMESYEKKDLTLWLFQQILMEDEFREVGDVGIVIKCYLRDAAADLKQLLEWTQQRGKPIWVRLAKGAYWDYETTHARALRWPVPVYTVKSHSDISFERATRFVIQTTSTCGRR
jgi:RHH-type proline utilization regulon transcriptional repressor/proline dehydrogenase/delta 1-pyrroline-5-carboxylate dehydrogenase